MSDMDASVHERISAFLNNLDNSTRITEITISDGYLWDKGSVIASVAFDDGKYTTQYVADATALERRRRITDDLLRQVAGIVSMNPGSPTVAVAVQLGTSHRNASRWVTQAKTRGFL